MPSDALLFDYLDPPLWWDKGRVLLPFESPPPNEINICALLVSLRSGALIASAVRGPDSKRFDVPAEFWESVSFHEIDWVRSRAKHHGLFAIRIRLATTPTVYPTPPVPRPGRPSSMHPVKEELQRRQTAGEVLPSLAEEARYLSSWAKDHCEGPQPKPESIENAIRGLYREHSPRNTPRN